MTAIVWDERLDQYESWRTCEHEWGKAYEDETLGWCRHCAKCQCYNLVSTPDRNNESQP